MMKKLLLFSFFSLLFLIISPTASLAARDASGWSKDECIDAGNIWYPEDSPESTCIAPPPKIKLQMPFGDLAASGQLDIRDYLKNLYTFGVGAAGILAVVMIILGGFIWLTAGGNAERVTTAKNYIQGALIGLVIALGSYTLLRIINPSLVYIVPLRVPVVKQAYLGDFCPLEVPEGQVAFQYSPNLTGTAETLGTTRIEPGEELICGYKYAMSIEGSQAATDCQGISCGTISACLPTGKLDSHKNLKTDCLIAESACVALDKDVAANLGMSKSQIVCDIINESLTAYKKGELSGDSLGACVWSIPDEGCAWCTQTQYTQTLTIINQQLQIGTNTRNQICQGISLGVGPGLGLFNNASKVCAAAWCNGVTGSITQ